MTASAWIDDVACVIVHHNSPDVVRTTLSALRDSGVNPRHIVVVDNSTSEAAAAAVQLLAEKDYSYLRTENRGYAAAANAGVDYLDNRSLSREFTLIATHESVASPGALLSLRDALRTDQSIAVAGPTLVDADSELKRFWSLGGRLTAVLKLPRHVLSMDDANADQPLVEREWLDGAFTLYRTELLRTFRLYESYFLYFEETDLHTRLRRAKYRVVWVPSAHVDQSSSGIPPHLLGRNLFIFHARLFSKTRGRAAVVFELVKSVARKALRNRGKWSDFGAIREGWQTGEAEVRMMKHVLLANGDGSSR